MGLASYKELIVWQKSIALAKEIYRLTAAFPKSEQYGLTLQMRRAAISIPSNIAEGYARKGRREYSQFISIAFGSGTELETQLYLAKELSLAPADIFTPSERLLREILSMLYTLRNKLGNTPS